MRYKKVKKEIEKKILWEIEKFMCYTLWSTVLKCCFLFDLSQFVQESDKWIVCV